MKSMLTVWHASTHDWHHVISIRAASKPECVKIIGRCSTHSRRCDASLFPVLCSPQSAPPPLPTLSFPRCPLPTEHLSFLHSHSGPLSLQQHRASVGCSSQRAVSQLNLALIEQNWFNPQPHFHFTHIYLFPNLLPLLAGIHFLSSSWVSPLFLSSIPKETVIFVFLLALLLYHSTNRLRLDAWHPAWSFNPHLHQFLSHSLTFKIVYLVHIEI